MKSCRIKSFFAAFAVAGLLSGGVAFAADAGPTVSRHAYRPLNAGPVEQLATVQQNVAPSRVVKAQPLIGQAANVNVNNLRTQSTAQLSASGIEGPVAPLAANQLNTQVPTAGVAQPLVVNPVAQSTHAQTVTNPYANAQQPQVYTSTTYTNYGHPSSYTVQTNYATRSPVYTRTYYSAPPVVYTQPFYVSSSYCAPTYYSYPRYRSSYSYCAPRVSYNFGYHSGYRGSYSRSHIGYRSSGFSFGFSYGRGGYGRCR